MMMGLSRHGPIKPTVQVLTSSVENGYVLAQVTYDDGTIQRWADERFGPNAVLIRSALVRLETP